MPSDIPSYSPQVQATNPQEASLNMRDIPGGAFGGAIGKGLEDGAHAVAQAVVDRGQGRLKDAGHLQLNKAETLLHVAYGEIVTDPKKGYLTKSGEDASRYRADTLAQLKKAAEEAEKDITLPRIKELYRARSAELLTRFTDSVNAHNREQQKHAAEASVKSHREMALRTISTSYQDDEQTEKLVTTAALRYETAFRAFAHERGMPAEQVQAEMQKWQQDMTATRINGYLGQRTVSGLEGAQRLFSRYREALGAEAPKFEHLITEHKEKMGAQATAVELYQKYRRSDGVTFDVAKAQKDLADRKDIPPSQRLETLALISKVKSETDHAQDQKNKQKFNNALTAFLDGGVEAIDARDTAYLKDKRNNAGELMEHLNQIIHRHITWNKSQPATEAQLLAEANAKVHMIDNWQQWQTRSPGDVAATFFNKDGTTLRPEQMRGLFDLLEHLHSKDQSSKAGGTLPRYAMTALLQGLRSRGFGETQTNDVSQWTDPKKAQRFLQLESELQQLFADHGRQKKQPPSIKDISEYVKTRLEEHEVPGYNKTVGVRYNRTAAPQVDFDIDPSLQDKPRRLAIDAIEKPERERIKKILQNTYKASGMTAREVTDDQILRYYQKRREQP
jgi:hypothetical protein